jgi:hypothetical protein
MKVTGRSTEEMLRDALAGSLPVWLRLEEEARNTERATSRTTSKVYRSYPWERPVSHERNLQMGSCVL